jgi:hypothetical protein
MNNRYRTAVALTSLLLLAGTPAPHRRHPAQAHAAAPSLDLYSPRALRRARTILQLKLLELRKARLERVRRAIERGLPVDQIVKP